LPLDMSPRMGITQKSRLLDAKQPRGAVNVQHVMEEFPHVAKLHRHSNIQLFIANRATIRNREHVTPIHDIVLSSPDTIRDETVIVVCSKQLIEPRD
jgi:hypothetical protein